MRWATDWGTQDLPAADLARFNARIFAPSMMGGRTIWSVDPVVSVDDLEGLLLRDDMPDARVWEPFGAVIVDLPIWETGEALARGIIEASYAGYPGAIPCCGHLPFNYSGDHFMRGQGGFAVLCNTDDWDALPEEYKEIYWDILTNEMPAIGEQITADYDRENNDRFLAEGGEDGTGAVIINQPDEGWAIPILEVLKDQIWPDLVQELDDAGYDGAFILNLAMETLERNGGFVPEFLRD
jgi:TRAP-type C4-dicarboxylate transport system substrate-binding protein